MPEKIYNLDSWAGYEVPRRRLLSRIKGLDNVVVLTGDEHQNFAGELRGGKGEGPALAVEFVATSISSGGDGSDQRAGSDRIVADNPHLKFINDQRGYILCEANRQGWRTDYKVLDTVRRPGGTLSIRQSFAVAPDEAKLQSA